MIVTPPSSAGGYAGESQRIIGNVPGEVWGALKASFSGVTTFGDIPSDVDTLIARAVPRTAVQINAEVDTALLDFLSTQGQSSGAPDSLISSATQGVKGSWIQLIASLTNASKVVAVFLSGLSGNIDFTVDIGTGAGGSEVVAIPDIYSSDQPVNSTMWLFQIAAATRLSARCANQSDAVARVCQVSIVVLD